MYLKFGYRIFFDDFRVFYATDTSTLEGISAKNYDLYLVEGNYEDEELEQRIKEKKEKGEFVNEYRVKQTHLSKGQASDFLLRNMGDKSQYVFIHEHVDKKQKKGDLNG